MAKGTSPAEVAEAEPAEGAAGALAAAVATFALSLLRATAILADAEDDSGIAELVRTAVAILGTYTLSQPASRGVVRKMTRDKSRRRS